MLLALVAVAGSIARGQEVGQEPPETPRRLSYLTATGRLAAYDLVSRVLTIHRATGSSEFHVAADARVWLTNKRLPLSELGAHVGAQVTVAWSGIGGVRTTHTIRVTETRAARGK